MARVISRRAGRFVAFAAAIALAGACTTKQTAAPTRSTTTGPAAVPAPTSNPTAGGAATTAPHAGAAAPTAVSPFVSPIRLDNRPTPVTGDVNGQMPDRDLVGVGPNCVASRAAGPSLGLLFATAREEGVILGARECYRSLSGQVAAQRNATAAGNSACAASVASSSSGGVKGTSMHGWGKAADLSDAQGGIAFGSPGDRFLNARAARLGWNHPGWARPGGSACPEPWHWEWVGDGGILHDSPIRADVVTLLSSGDGRGYSTVTGLGAITHHGDGPDYGSEEHSTLAWLVTGAARTPDGHGYWLVGSDGAVFSFGTAGSFGSVGGAPPASPVVGMAATPDGHGYWLVGADGRIFSFGSAGSYGSPAASALSLHRPVVGMATTPTGRGYWVASADGGVYGYGDAGFYGAAAGRSLPAPVVALAATPDGHGYWLVGADGTVYAFGNATVLGSAAGVALAEPVVAVAPTPSGRGYWLGTADGGVFTYGDAGYFGAG